MATVFESISLAGLRKTHLYQLLTYLEHRDRDGWYYGNKKQFEERHKDLRKWVCDALECAHREGVVMPKKKDLV